jgi:hypothetical protein
MSNPIQANWLHMAWHVQILVSLGYAWLIMSTTLPSVAVRLIRMLLGTALVKVTQLSTRDTSCCTSGTTVSSIYAETYILIA